MPDATEPAGVDATDPGTNALIVMVLVVMVGGRVAWSAGWLPGLVAIAATVAIVVPLIVVVTARVARREGLHATEVLRRGFRRKRRRT